MSKSATCLIAMCLAACGLAAAPVRKGAVEAELVGAVTSVQPGQSFTIALRMKHDPHWHTYWINPGTGYATSLKWSLPPGFKAEEIQWPVPEVFADASGKITGHGYEGENFLMIRIMPPVGLKAGANITLKAHAEWLMCREVCMPGEVELTLTLPVKMDAPRPDEKWAEKIAQAASRLPVVLPPGWSASAVRNGATVQLHLIVGSGPRPSATSLHFLPLDDFIDYAQPQAVKVVRDGYVFDLAIAEGIGPRKARLTGVIRADNGWGIPGEVVGLKVSTGLLVDVPLDR